MNAVTSLRGIALAIQSVCIDTNTYEQKTQNALDQIEEATGVMLDALTKLEAHLTEIIEWHEVDPDDTARCACNLGYPCPSLEHAAAALLLLGGPDSESEPHHA